MQKFCRIFSQLLQLFPRLEFEQAVPHRSFLHGMNLRMPSLGCCRPRCGGGARLEKAPAVYSAVSSVWSHRSPPVNL